MAAYYNTPNLSMTIPAGGLLDKLTPPSFLAAAFYAVTGIFITNNVPDARLVGQTLMMISLIPAYRAWQFSIIGKDYGKGV